MVLTLNTETLLKLMDVAWLTAREPDLMGEPEDVARRRMALFDEAMKAAYRAFKDAATPESSPSGPSRRSIGM